MPQSFACLHLHLIFSTKHREPMLAAPVIPRLFEYVGGILRNNNCALIAANAMPDHIHLLVSLSRELSVSELLRLIKTNSSKWIHETFPDMTQFGWQNGYAAFVVSKSGLDAVNTYIANQQKHHEKKTFQQEYVEFLKAHDIAYDERYLWD